MVSTMQINFGEYCRATLIEANVSRCFDDDRGKGVPSFDDVPSSLPPAVTNILQEFTDVFSQDVPPGLPPIRGIEHRT